MARSPRPKKPIVIERIDSSQGPMYFARGRVDDEIFAHTLRRQHNRSCHPYRVWHSWLRWTSVNQSIPNSPEFEKLIGRKPPDEKENSGFWVWGYLWTTEESRIAITFVYEHATDDLAKGQSIEESNEQASAEPAQPGALAGAA